MKKKNMEKTNFIIIVTDDQGYGDLSCMGSKDLHTPNFDKLAASGILFTQFYASSPVCSPSRASLLTGMYPSKTGVNEILEGNRDTKGITSHTPTLATVLKKSGYNTACIGKWHLGSAYESRPNQNGFDYFYGFLSGCIDYYSQIFYWNMADGRSNPVHDLWENNDETYLNGEYFTEVITEKSIQYINSKSDKDEPFFLYISYNAPHYPMHAPSNYMQRYNNMSWDRQVMAAMLSAVDDGIGNILKTLQENKILDNTFIFFQSDNGPSRESRNWLDGTVDSYYGGKASGFKGHKASLFEGGIRVPAILSYPEKFPKAQVNENVYHAIDIFPTILKIAEVNIEEFEIDGQDISDAICHNEISPQKMYFWGYRDQLAVRFGDYKLVINGYDVDEIDHSQYFLSNIKNDPGEKVNLYDKNPEVKEMLISSVLKWKNSN